MDPHLKAIVIILGIYFVCWVLWQIGKGINKLGTGKMGVPPTDPNFPQHEVLWHEEEPQSLGAPLEWNRTD